MHDQRSYTPAEADDSTDQAVLGLLVHDSPRLWSDDEIAREIGDRTVASDAVARLYGAGLVHRLGGFAFATRPALVAARLAS